ncbi:MAG: HPr family phosphocarrier protein [Spirochaetaceae bacterium]|jgi:phosphocarrier protein|nr:HPr family phosphocarrier protein [Spirochaetaceae bacterium]
MTERTITVSNRAGVHARPAAMIVEIAKDFKSKIYIEKDNDRINGKSIMGILTMGAGYGTELNIVTEGPDEIEALEALVRLFEAKFEE